LYSLDAPLTLQLVIPIKHLILKLKRLQSKIFMKGSINKKPILNKEVIENSAGIQA